MLYTREAGIGRLAVSMEGPSKTDINVRDLQQGTCDVTYTCTLPGQSFFVTLCLSDKCSSRVFTSQPHCLQCRTLY